MKVEKSRLPPFISPLGATILPDETDIAKAIGDIIKERTVGDEVKLGGNFILAFYKKPRCCGRHSSCFFLVHL